MSRPSEAPTVSARSRETFRPEDRLRRRWEFREAQTRGRRIHAPHFLVIVLPRPSSPNTRLGITVTKKVSSSAVARNRVKRLVREVFRRNRAWFPAACDVVVIAKQGAPALSYGEVAAELSALSRPMMRAATAPASEGTA
jgi:ribonuclease P protein component